MISVLSPYSIFYTPLIEIKVKQEHVDYGNIIYLFPSFRLLTENPVQRLGATGAGEVKLY